MKQARLYLVALAGILLVASCSSENDNVIVDDRDQFTGTWNCKETENSASPVTITFQISISKKGSTDSLLVDNFNNIGSGFKALFLVSGTSIAIPTQTVGGFNITEGSGFLSSNKITLSYKVDNVLYDAECTK